MHIFELFERAQRDRIPNPLNGGVVSPQVYEFMDYIDDVESDFIEELNLDPSLPIQQRVSLARDKINELGTVMDIEISKLTSMEPDYDKIHADSITNGEPASVYKHNNTYYINDGNHRVIAAYNKGDKTTKANVVDVEDMLKFINPGQ